MLNPYFTDIKTEIQINLSNLPTYIKEYIISKLLLSQDCKWFNFTKSVINRLKEKKKKRKYRLIL